MKVNDTVRVVKFANGEVNGEIGTIVEISDPFYRVKLSVPTKFGRYEWLFMRDEIELLPTDLNSAQELLDALMPGRFEVKEKPFPFYVNSPREPKVGDIVAVDSIIGGKPNYYLYTAVTRNIGYNNQYPTNWVSVKHGTPDTGPTFGGRRRELVFSVPV